MRQENVAHNHEREKINISQPTILCRYLTDSDVKYYRYDKENEEKMGKMDENMENFNKIGIYLGK